LDQALGPDQALDLVLDLVLVLDLESDLGQGLDLGPVSGQAQALALLRDSLQ
jgi:hypothetical protein